MADGRSNRKRKIIPFVDQLSKDRRVNLEKIILTAKNLSMDGFETVIWDKPVWQITGGRLTKSSGKNRRSASLEFKFPLKLGEGLLEGEWAEAAKALFLLRFHRDHQYLSNQRNFITAIGYVAHAANNINIKIERLNCEVLNAACLLISKDYAESTAYNLFKAVGEFSGICDANMLCRIKLDYKYARMIRPEGTGGVGHMRLDDPATLETKSDKLVDPLVFKILGELYLNVPKNHKYRFYVLLLTLLACTGRRFTEITLLPLQKLNEDENGKCYLYYFPRKTSQGDTYTPQKKLYMPSDVVEIVKGGVDELNDLCRPARETAIEMHEKSTADLRFLSNIDDNKRLYKDDLEALGISPGVLDKNGWIRVNKLSFPDYEKLNHNNRLPNHPFQYTTKAGVIAYCQKDYNDSYNNAIHIDQLGNEYYLGDLLLVRHQGLSSGAYSHWIATQCTHSMMTTFLRYFPDLSKEFASSSIEIDFTSHHFRHTLNTLMDEGGLSDLIQTEWFGRSNPRDTKAYQHTSREKRALMLREDIKKGNVGGKIAETIKAIPIDVQDAVLNIRIKAVHDVGTGICIHDFSQLPCERHLQCSADCDDYVWAKNDEGRIDELKRQYALTALARKTAEDRLITAKPKKSADWLVHNDKKLKTLSTQLVDNGITDFDHEKYLAGIET